MSRQPYVQQLPRATWWLRQGRYKRYIAREITCIFIGVYTTVLLVGVKQLSEGPGPYQAFLDALAHPLWVAFHVAAFAFAAYNSVTWFAVTPKAIRVQRGTAFVPDVAIAAAHYLGWIAVSVLVLYLAGR